jgi:hypothetical protein
MEIEMPIYFRPSVFNTLQGTGFNIGLGTVINPDESVVINTNSGNCCCPSTTNFFETLVNKLEEMTLSLKEQFAELIRPPIPNKNLILSSAGIEVPQADLFYEYVVYVQRYGPPPNGQFDPDLLDIIIAELALENP